MASPTALKNRTKRARRSASRFRTATASRIVAARRGRMYSEAARLESPDERRPQSQFHGDGVTEVAVLAALAACGFREASARGSIRNPPTRSDAAAREKSAPRQKIETKVANVSAPMRPGRSESSVAAIETDRTDIIRGKTMTCNATSQMEANGSSECTKTKSGELPLL